MHGRACGDMSTLLGERVGTYQLGGLCGWMYQMNGEVCIVGYGVGMGKPMGLEVWVCEVLVRVGQSKPSSTMGFLWVS